MKSPENLYVHFPFCRAKCAYCALYSRAGVSASARAAYVDGLVREFVSRAADFPATFHTVYFGGGSPTQCDLKPFLQALSPYVSQETEFTVEVHPLDVTVDVMRMLKDGGVSRISMGVQSLDDAVLTAMGRGYSLKEAEAAFARVKGVFDNAGIDLIVGFPGDSCEGYRMLEGWGLRHCSVYSLQNERKLQNVPDDDWVLDRLRAVAETLGDLGLERYEISNYAQPGFACRHNLAVWRGEDYLGLGEGACGRIGLVRTRGVRGTGPASSIAYETTHVSPDRDEIERRIFRLRTREGLDASGHPEWDDALQSFCREGLLRREGPCVFLTARGTEVCDTILAELV